MALSRSSSRQPMSRFSRSMVLRRWLRLWMTMLFSMGVRYILNFRFFIGRSFFTFSVYIETTLHRKCASLSTWNVTAVIQKDKINWIRFGQILTNQDIPFKRKPFTKAVMESKKWKPAKFCQSPSAFLERKKPGKPHDSGLFMHFWIGLPGLLSLG